MLHRPEITNRILAVLFFLFSADLCAEGTVNWEAGRLDELPAALHPSAQVTTLLDATKAGDSVVAVGDHGVVLLSEDGGKSFRQADKVPTRTTLTAVFFINSQTGWAVGNQGTVLVTNDGGETWVRTRGSPDELALFSVWFKDEKQGFAAGRFATLLETTDGGNNWKPVNILSENDELERNLFQVFPGRNGRIHIAAEAGAVYTSEDGGDTWSMTDTGYLGSFWSGVALKDGTLVLVGMRGTIYTSEDGGTRWQKRESGSRSSFTDIIERSDGSLIAVGLNGVIARSKNGSGPFVASVHPERVSLTAVIEQPDGEDLLFGKSGLIKD